MGDFLFCTRHAICFGASLFSLPFQTIMATHLPLHEKRKILLYLGASDEALFKWTHENLLRPGRDHVVLLACVPKGGRRRSSTSSTGSFDGVRRRLSLPLSGPPPSTNGSAASTAVSSSGHEGGGSVWDDVDEARDTLEQFAHTLKQDDITNEEHVIPGDPRELLPRFARDHSGMNMVVASEASKKVNIGSSLGEKLAKEVGSQCTIVMIRNPQQLSTGLPTMVKEE
ncbi:unnamed protein product [Umbelopsis ramanniana]